MGLIIIITIIIIIIIIIVIIILLKQKEIPWEFNKSNSISTAVGVNLTRVTLYWLLLELV